MANKPHMNLVTVGHVDQGKSTLVGRLLYDTGAVSEEEMRKLKDLAKELKKETFEFAFVMDQLKEERERGVTIDVMHKRFDSAKYYFTIIDAPGHRDFIKNMITGASQADAACLVCSGKPGETEAGIGATGQAREHIFLLKVLGVQQIIVAINKMDAANYDEARFKTVKDEVSKLLKNVGYNPDKIDFVPVSAWIGDNVAKKSDKMAWYSGPTLLEALDKLTLPAKPLDKPLRLPIQDVYTITGIGTVPVGRIETGTLNVGETVVFMPSGAKGEVKTIEMHHEQIPKAEPGDNVGFSVRGIDKATIKRGDVAGPVNNPPTVAKEFEAQIIVLYHPNVITKGYTPVFHCGTSQTACKVTEIIKKIDPKTGGTLAENPDFIKTGDAAIIRCVPTKPMVLEDSKTFPELARFAIRDMGQTVAAGVCLKVVPAEAAAKK
jgi:elongation factor 1-alpha